MNVCTDRTQSRQIKSFIPLAIPTKMQKNLHGHNDYMQIFLFLKQTFSESLNFFFFLNTFLCVLRNFAACLTKRCNMEEINERKEETGTGQQYAELFCDFMFKRLFGSEANKDVLR